MRSTDATRIGAGGAFLRFGALSLALHAALGAAVVAFAGFPRLPALHRVILFELVDAPGGSGAPAKPAAAGSAAGGAVAAVREPPARPSPAEPGPLSVPASIPDVPPALAGPAPVAVPATAAEPERTGDVSGIIAAGAAHPTAVAGSGQGSGGAASPGARSEAPGGSRTGDEGDPSSQARAGYIDLLLGSIDRRKEYPRAARRLGHEGTVVVGFEVRGDGRVGSVAVERSSGSPILDAAALKAVSGAGRFPPPPPAFRGGETKFVLPVQFRLDPPAGRRSIR
ncbi:MAG: energy transducer TonB [Thermodesulfobacteriota bacterium]